MIDMDAQENDRLLLAEAERRRELINQAVSSFAPHLRDAPGLQVVHVHSANASLRKLIRDMFKGSRAIVVEHCRADGRERRGRNEVQHECVHLPLPRFVDLVITKANLNFKIELLAAQLKALPVVLPEGEDYLRARLDRQSVLVLAGADLAG